MVRCAWWLSHPNSHRVPPIIPHCIARRDVMESASHPIETDINGLTVVNFSQHSAFLGASWNSFEGAGYVGTFGFCIPISLRSKVVAKHQLPEWCIFTSFPAWPLVSEEEEEEIGKNSEEKQINWIKHCMKMGRTNSRSLEIYTSTQKCFAFVKYSEKRWKENSILPYLFLLATLFLDVFDKYHHKTR